MPKPTSTMSPTRNQNETETAYEIMYKKRILRRQMLRLKMLKEQNFQKRKNHTRSIASKQISPLKLNSAVSVNAKKISPILMRPSKPVTNLNTKPINIAITFNATSKNDSEREFRTFELNTIKQELPVMPEKARKQWPKLVCSMEISPITSHDFIVNGAVLSSAINFSFSPPNPPPPHSPKVLITAPPPSSPPPPVSQVTNLHTTITQHADKFLAPKKRRFVLSDRPPPMFKAPLKDPYIANYKSVRFADLRRKITGNMPELHRETLKMREDDCISIYAQTDIITDDDLDINADKHIIEPTITATKHADIINWVAQSSSSSATSLESDTNAPQFSSNSSSCTNKFNDSPESINCPSIDENTNMYHRFDHFQLNLNSETSETNQSASCKVDTPSVQNSFKIPYSANAKSSKVRTYSSSPFDGVSANSRYSPDFHSSVNECDTFNCDSSVIIPESEKPLKEVARSLDSSEVIRNVSKCNINNQTSSQYFDILNFSANEATIDEFKHSPPIGEITRSVDNTLNQQKSIPNISKTCNKNEGKLISETSNQKSAQINNTTNKKPIDQTGPLNHFQFKRPPPNFTPNQLKNMHFNNTPLKNIPPLIGAPNNIKPPETYFTRPPMPTDRPFNGPPIRGPFQPMPPYQRFILPNYQQKFPGPRYQRMINVNPQPLIGYPQPPIGYRQIRPIELPRAAQMNLNAPPPPRKFTPLNAPHFWDSQNWCQSDQKSVQSNPLLLSQIQAVLCNVCSWHYTEGTCRFGAECRKYHQCPQELAQSLALLQLTEIQNIVSKLCANKLHGVICELLDYFLQAYVRNNNVMAILGLVQPILEVNFSSYNKVQAILGALCQLGMNYNSAILKVLYYVGASNRKLVDILFSIITDHCDATSSSSVASNWSAIEQLLETATQLDHGVFADLCAKSVAQHTNTAVHATILITLGRVLTAEPSKVNVQRMQRTLLEQLCERLEVIDGGGLGALMRSRFMIGWSRDTVMDQRERMPEDSTISSTIPGPNNSNFIQVPLQNSNATITTYTKHKSSATNTDRNQNSCSPDSSSYAAATKNYNHPFTSTTPHRISTPSTPPFHTPPIPPTPPFNIQTTPHSSPFSIPPMSPVTPLLTQSGHCSAQRPEQSIIPHHLQSHPPPSISPSTTLYNLTENHSLYSCIIKYQYNAASVLIAKDRDSAIEPVCKMIHCKTVPVSTAFAFFDVMWDLIQEHFLEYIDLKRVVLYILFNIYEFLWKECCFTDAVSLITTKFVNEKESFLCYKTFLPSGQCSPMQKCHRVIKLLLQEKLLQPAYDWFIREEYQSIGIASDMNNLADEKNSLIVEFLQLSYRDLDIAFNLVTFCMNRHLGDFKHHYNCILMQMINSNDHKEKVIALRERLYNDQYVYISSQTLRSYVVDFFSHLTLNELLHIYDIISHDNVYPKLTGHEHIVTIRDTLKENELTLILMNYFHKIKQNKIDVTWDVKIRFQTETMNGPLTSDVRAESIVYPRNLLMCSTPIDAVIRLVNVLRSNNLMLSNTAEAHKWHACHTSGTVTLYKDHVQAMVMNYRGTQTFT